MYLTNVFLCAYKSQPVSALGAESSTYYARVSPITKGADVP